MFSQCQLQEDKYSHHVTSEAKVTLKPKMLWYVPCHVADCAKWEWCECLCMSYNHWQTTSKPVSDPLTLIQALCHFSSKAWQQRAAFVPLITLPFTFFTASLCRGREANSCRIKWNSFSCCSDLCCASAPEKDEMTLKKMYHMSTGQEVVFAGTLLY